MELDMLWWASSLRPSQTTNLSRCSGARVSESAIWSGSTFMAQPGVQVTDQETLTWLPCPAFEQGGSFDMSFLNVLYIKTSYIAKYILSYTFQLAPAFCRRWSSTYEVYPQSVPRRRCSQKDFWRSAVPREWDEEPGNAEPQSKHVAPLRESDGNNGHQSKQFRQSQGRSESPWIYV